MKRYVLFIVLIFLVTSNLNAKNTSFTKGKSYKGDFKWGFVDYKFPEGEWILFHKDKQTLPGTNLMTRCIEFYQQEKNIVKGTISFCDIVTGGKFTPTIAMIVKNLLKNDKYDNCTLRAEYFYAQLFTKGTSMNCLMIRHIDTYKELNYPDDPSTVIKYKKNFLEKNNLQIPKTMIVSRHLFFAPSVRDKGVEVTYAINPELFGAPATINGDENNSEYHRNNINNFPKKKDFMNQWLSNRAKYHKIFEKNIKAKSHHLLDLDKFINQKKAEEKKNLLTNQLKNLTDLYKSGVLTEEEFKKAKKKILD